MIELSDEAQDALTRSHKVFFRVDSWYDGRLVGDNIPFMSGYEEQNSFMDVQERAEFRIPRISRDGTDWSPTTTEHPLAANGQKLQVTLGVGQANNEPDWFRRSWFLIEETEFEGDEIIVSATGLLHAVSEADFVGPFQPSGTFASTVRELVQPQIGVVFDDDLEDRNVPANLRFESSRIGALYETLDAWPAEAVVHQNGYLYVRPLLESRTPALNLLDGQGGTIITSSGRNTRNEPWNCVVARGKDADGTPIQAVAYNIDANHPKQYGGPFNRLAVPFPFESDLIHTYYQAKAVAKQKLRQKMKQNAASFEIEMVPHPAIQIGDVLSITTPVLTNQIVEVTQLRLPYNHDGGSMRLTVRAI